MGASYERVLYRPEGAKRAKAVMLRNVRVNGEFLTGTEVDEDGCDREPDAAFLRANGCVTGTRLHVIEAALVVRREPYEMDLYYGWLVPTGTAEQPVTAPPTAG